MAAEEYLYYGIGEQDYLDCEFSECIERFVDAITEEQTVCQSWSYFAMPVPELPGQVEVTVYRQSEVSIEGLSPLAALLEQLDDRHGFAPEQDPAPTGRMLEAERAFLHTVADEYRRSGGGDGCRRIGAETVDLAEWLPAAA